MIEIYTSFSLAFIAISLIAIAFRSMMFNCVGIGFGLIGSFLFYAAGSSYLLTCFNSTTPPCNEPSYLATHAIAPFVWVGYAAAILNFLAFFIKILMTGKGVEDT